MQAGAGTQDWYIKLNDEDVVVVCTIIATAEYCIEVVGALGRSVAKTIDPPFGNKVRTWNLVYTVVTGGTHGM
jgi:hypothetical protein